MKKPLLPVSDKWLRPLLLTNAYRAYSPFAYQCDAEQFRIPNAVIVGTFGHFITVMFDGRSYLMPDMHVQWLLWSFENKVGDQFSNEEQLFLVGTSGHAAVVAKLDAEMTAILDWMHRPETSTAVTKSVTSKMRNLSATIDQFLDGCPEPMFFDSGIAP